MKSTLVFVALSLFIFLSLNSLSSGKHPPFVPKDLFHDGVINDAACTTCHTPGTQTRERKTHTLKLDCMTCHKEVQRMI
jgi:hypothetical protein